MKFGHVADFGRYASFQPANQVRNLGSERTRVDVRLIDSDMTPVRTKNASEQRSVLGTEKQVLKHGIVREQDVRGVRTDFLA